MSNDNKAMRKLKLQVQMSVDGCIAGPNNETDWLTRGNDSFKYVNDIVDSSDTILMGRKMVDGFIPYWTEVAGKLDDPIECIR